MILVKNAVALALLVLCLTGCSGTQAEQRNFFKEGRQLVVSGQYQDAIPILETYLEKQPKGKHASRAGLFLGKAHLAQEQYAKAAEVWENTAKNYPQTLEAHKCHYKLALLHMLQGQNEEALAGFEKLAQDPNGPLAPEARAMSLFLKKK